MIKADNHRHLGGSISSHTVCEILRRQFPHMAIDAGKIHRDMTYAPGEALDFRHFLNKFKILDVIQWDEEAIKSTIEQVCWDIAKEGIKYCELKFSVNKYVRHTGWPVVDTIKLVHNLVAAECEKWDISIALVLSLKYEANRDEQQKMARVIDNPDIVEILSGIDLVGDESFYDYQFYQPIFREWGNVYKRGLVAHVGETQSAENVRTAIEKLGVKRISHGISIVDSPEIMALAKDRDICFDVALTSNLCTGVVKDLREHPVKRMLDFGLSIAIGTDDPSVLSTTLDEEYQKLISITGVPEEKLSEIMENSIKYASAGVLWSPDTQK